MYCEMVNTVSSHHHASSPTSRDENLLDRLSQRLSNTQSGIGKFALTVLRVAFQD